MAERASEATSSANWPARVALLAAFVVLIGVAYALGWHRQLSLETLVRHRAAIEAFIGAHYLLALGMFIGIYIGAVSLSIPVAFLLTITGGFLFGPVIGPLAAIAGATIGGTVVFLVAQTALGEFLARRAGPRVAKLAEGFRADAFHYLLFLRLTPIFPFWLVNLAPALFGVPLRTFILATIIGVAPATFAYGFLGSGLGSVIAAQEVSYNECVAAGRAFCQLNFDVRDAVTPQLLAALAALGLAALIPVAVKRLRARREKARG